MRGLKYNDPTGHCESPSGGKVDYDSCANESITYGEVPPNASSNTTQATSSGNSGGFWGWFWSWFGYGEEEASVTTSQNTDTMEQPPALSEAGPNPSSNNVVYRVIRSDENPSEGLTAKNPSANYSPEGHVLNGSKSNFKSQYISTTKDIQVANEWAGKTGNRIVKIDLDKVDGNVIDLSTDIGRDTYLKGPMSRNFAKASSEVLIEGSVPADAITIVKK